jgi:hypothetical protein
LRRNSGVGVSELLNYRSVHKRPIGGRSPTAPRGADSSKSRFILKHDPDGTALGPGHNFFRPDEVGEFFLNSS